MALEEHDREDLLRDGRTMGVRGQTVIDDHTVLVGFREQGQASIYFGSERVFQFDQAHLLRRVYFDGRRLAAQQGKLVELVRESSGGRVELTRRDIGNDDSRTILSAIDDVLLAIRSQLRSDQCSWEIVGAEPEDFRPRVAAWLNKISSPLEIASGPAA